MKINENNKKSFINDQEKMVDFFTVPKDQFLKFYSYILEDEYEATKKEVLKKSGYWNADVIAEDEAIDGTVIEKIIQSIMLIEWLKTR